MRSANDQIRLDQIRLDQIILPNCKEKATNGIELRFDESSRKSLTGLSVLLRNTMFVFTLMNPTGSIIRRRRRFRVRPRSPLQPILCYGTPARQEWAVQSSRYELVLGEARTREGRRKWELKSWRFHQNGALCDALSVDVFLQLGV